MLKWLFSIFLILHGLVHLLYAGQSQRIFELQPGMTWPDGSWALSRIAGAGGTRLAATALLVCAALLFVASGVGLLAGQTWWRTLALTAAAVATLVFILLWDLSPQDLPGQGAVGILINAAIAAAVLWLPALQTGS